MPIFIVPIGETTYGIGVCDRCKFKKMHSQLSRDPNYPGLRVCNDKDGCLDQFDPWRLPPRQTENITLRFVRPDVPLQGRQKPVYQILAERLVTQDGQAILTQDGQYIDIDLPPLPDSEPLT